MQSKSSEGANKRDNLVTNRSLRDRMATENVTYKLNGMHLIINS